MATDTHTRDGRSPMLPGREPLSELLDRRSSLQQQHTRASCNAVVVCSNGTLPRLTSTMTGRSRLWACFRSGCCQTDPSVCDQHSENTANPCDTTRPRDGTHVEDKRHNTPKHVSITDTTWDGALQRVAAKSQTPARRSQQQQNVVQGNSEQAQYRTARATHVSDVMSLMLSGRVPLRLACLKSRPTLYSTTQTGRY